LIADYPALPETNLRDDTPAANPDTKAWLNELIPPDRPARPPSPEPPTFVPRFPEHEQLEAIDVYELAEQAARSGRHAEAVEMLAGEAARERSGRARFQRRIQIAQICIASGRDTVARPILRDIVAEIDARKLEDWEDPEMLSHALALLYRLENAGGEAHDNANEKERVFARLCRLDAGRALELAP
ncbi:MAG: type VI secretion system domain-containing protein, partial [Acidobacteriota bacterium]|nr:type VI secretion system domain-containing protein [Acidobacteriota bacterium]